MKAGYNVNDYIDRTCVENLNKICSETGAGVVITSNWKIGKTANELQRLLNRFGFTGKVFGKTVKTKYSTGYEISLWCNDNRFMTSYVILDSEVVDPELEFQVRTDYYGKGLTIEHVKSAIELLNRND